jgi:hypothetical protein
MKFKLIGSSNSIEHLLDLVTEKYFCRSQVSFINVKKNQWVIHQQGKPIDGLRVVLKRGRYRFERQVTQ